MKDKHEHRVSIKIYQPSASLNPSKFTKTVDTKLMNIVYIGSAE